MNCIGFRRLLMLATLLCTSACANLNSIFRSRAIDNEEARVVSIDAKQRVILSNPMSRTTTRTVVGHGSHH